MLNYGINIFDVGINNNNEITIRRSLSNLQS